MRKIVGKLLLALSIGVVLVVVFIAILGGNPEINPSDFTTEITNGYFSIAPGKRMVYQAETGNGLERVEISVGGETKNIIGVETLVYRDKAFLDGELIEDTRDYLAQDKEGNVWYFGEDVDNFKDGRLINHQGAWEAGVAGAKPGFWIKANPQVGDTYQQEFARGVAEDRVQVVSTDETVTVPFGTFTSCVKTLDTNPLEPQARENKYYCPKVNGLVLEVDLVSGERLELIDVNSGA